MDNFKVTVRSVFRKDRKSLTKILSLAVGLAMGLVLITRVFFEMSYDNFYPDIDRIYQIQTMFKIGDGDFEDPYSHTSGAIAPGMKMEIPAVESATRFTFIVSEKSSILTDEKKRFSFSDAILGDTSLFDVLPRPIFAGNAKQTLSTPQHVLISRSVAEKIGDIENLMGKIIYLDNFPDVKLIIGGVFEDIPENSHLHYDIIVSMSSISNFIKDGSLNWIGNDRYFSYIKLHPGTDRNSLIPLIREMQEKYQPLDRLKEENIDLKYTLEPLKSLYKNLSTTKQMNLLLAILAFAVIFTAVMNYILIMISTLVNCSKGIAVEKCYGATDKNISFNIFLETFFYVVISLLVAIAIIILSKNLIEELLSTSLSALFNFRSIVFLMLICGFIFLLQVSSLHKCMLKFLFQLPCRDIKKKENSGNCFYCFFSFWQQVFLFSLLIVIGLQYNKMINDNPGYEYEDIIYIDLTGVSDNNRKVIIDELNKFSEIKDISTVSNLPFYSPSGNGISLPESEEHLFTASDLEYVNDNFLSMMEIPILAGNNFDKNSTKDDILVSQSFAQKILLHSTSMVDLIGKQIKADSQEKTIRGIYADFRIGSIIHGDQRPSIMSYSPDSQSFLLMKMNQVSSENIQKINQKVKSLLPDKEMYAIPYKEEIINLYKSSRMFRDAVIIGGLVTLIITFIGLIGYLNDEMMRRRKEIAIRRINGSTVNEIQKLFLADIYKIALPALIIGATASAFAVSKWMENFSEKADIPIFIYLLSVAIVLLIIFIVIYVGTYRTAIQNPAETIKSD